MSDQSVQLRAGLNNVGSYQVSGVPFVSGGLTLPLTSSANLLRIDFPSVSNIIYFTNHGSYHARVGFSENGVKGTNYYLIEPSGSIELKVKATSIFLASNHPSNTLSSCTLAASLTGITGYDLTTAFSGTLGIG